MKEIVKYYNRVLRKKAEPVEFGEDALRLAGEMKEILKKEQGAGLAAPQIGESKQIIVINTGEELVAFFNPEIKMESRETTKIQEGCLSVPGVWIDVERFKKIKMKAMDEKGDEVEIRAKDMLAVILQHEEEHLRGVLIIDKVGFFKRWRLIFTYYLKRVFKRR